MRLTPILAPLALLALAGCMSPREQCIADGTQEFRTLERLIAETEGNIARGYAIRIDQEVTVTPGRCPVRLPDGTTGSVRCEETDVDDVRVPVAIDLRAEQAKLDSLVERRNALAAQQTARIEACTRAYPE